MPEADQPLAEKIKNEKFWYPAKRDEFF